MVVLVVLVMGARYGWLAVADGARMLMVVMVVVVLGMVVVWWWWCLWC